MKREKWGRGEWGAVLVLTLLFFPLGIAALLRWIHGEWVFYPPQEKPEDDPERCTCNEHHTCEGHRA